MFSCGRRPGLADGAHVSFIRGAASLSASGSSDCGAGPWSPGRPPRTLISHISPRLRSSLSRFPTILSARCACALSGPVLRYHGHVARVELVQQPRRLRGRDHGGVRRCRVQHRAEQVQGVGVQAGLRLVEQDDRALPVGMAQQRAGEQQQAPGSGTNAGGVQSFAPVAQHRGLAHPLGPQRPQRRVGAGDNPRDRVPGGCGLDGQPARVGGEVRPARIELLSRVVVDRRRAHRAPAGFGQLQREPALRRPRPRRSFVRSFRVQRAAVVRPHDCARLVRWHGAAGDREGVEQVRLAGAVGADQHRQRAQLQRQRPRDRAEARDRDVLDGHRRSFRTTDFRFTPLVESAVRRLVRLQADASAFGVLADASLRGRRSGGLWTPLGRVLVWPPS